PSRSPASSSATTWRGSLLPTPSAAATCCPTSACRGAHFSTGPDPKTCPGPSRSFPPTACPYAGHSVRDGVALPVVAVVGRPNVGKSTLVNRMLGRREAIVEEHPGVTRDRKVVEAEWRGRPFTVVDTGGWGTGAAGLDRRVSRQGERAVREAGTVVLVVAATLGVTEPDDRVAG